MTRDGFTAELVDVARQVVDETPGERFATARRIHETLERQHRGRQRRIKLTALAFAGVCAFAVVARYTADQTADQIDRPDQPVAASTQRDQPDRREPARPVDPTTPPIAEPAPALSPSTPPVQTPSQHLPSPAPSPATPSTPPAPPSQPLPSHPQPIGPQTPPAKRISVPRPAPVVPSHAESQHSSVDPRATATPAELAGPDRPERAAATAPDPSEELKSYRLAHEAHFHGADPAAALAAWDSYLAKYPNGQLALEARYARALVLIKLERWNEAAAALRPFASAPPGSYRQTEAARLLGAIPGH